MNIKTLHTLDYKNSRLDNFLNVYLENLSRTQIQKIIFDGYVKVDGKNQKASYKLGGTETVSYSIPKLNDPLTRITPQKLELDILYEDNEIIAINKPAGLVVHPGAAQIDATLANGLLYHFSKLSDINGPIRPGIVHRLDKDTSGVILVAKSNKSHAALARQFENRTIKKEYLGITWGVWNYKNGEINKSLKRKRTDPTSYEVNKEGKSSLTNFKIIKSGKYLSEVLFMPKSGRTHQIRVHSSSENHPIFSDKKYGGGKSKAKGYIPEDSKRLMQLLKQINRHALHASEITFEHPFSFEKITLRAPIPSDLTELKKSILNIHD